MATTYSADWVLPIDAPPIENGAVTVEGDTIIAVGPASELGPSTRHDGAAIIPAFVNAHSHLEYAVYAGFGDGLAFPPWIGLHIRRKQALSFEDMVSIARLGAAECLRSGIGTVADASFSGAAALACDDLGLRGIVCLEIFGRDPAFARETLERLREAAAPAAESPLVTLGVSPHAPYSTAVELYALATELDLPLVTHLSESVEERQWMEQGTGEFAALADFMVPPPGRTGLRLLAAEGLLGPRMIAAHCVDLDPDELATLAEHDVAVAHCPRSNGYLGCGFAPLADLLAAGVRVGIGTDSPASTPSFDMFEELRMAVAVARAREQRPDALTAGQALELATLGGARALGLDDQIGSLTPGKRADLAIVTLDESSLVPWEDPTVAVALGGSPAAVEMTIVAGQTRYEKGGFEWHDLRSAAASARGRMLETPGALPAR